MVKISKLLSDKKRGIKVENSNDFIEISRKGLTIKQLKDILKFTQLTLKQISKILSISQRQLLRYDDEKILKSSSSSHLVQILDLYEFGYSVFEKEENFQTWMHSEIRALNYQKPFDLLDTTFGILELKNILGRIEYGVFS